METTQELKMDHTHTHTQKGIFQTWRKFWHMLKHVNEIEPVTKNQIVNFTHELP